MRALAVVLALVGAPATLVPPAGAGVVVPPGDDLFVVHDSVVINARPQLRHRLESWNVEYLGFHGMQAAAANEFLDRRTAPIPDTVVVALNFNRRTPAEVEADFQGLLSRLAPAKRIIWVLPGIYGDHIPPFRETMLDVVSQDVRVEVVDWHEYYRTSNQIVDYLGVHLTDYGAWVYAAMIDRVLDRVGPGDLPSTGNVGQMSSRPTGESVSGWALDLESAASRRVDVYVDGEHRRRVRADRTRQDVAVAYGLGAEHGFRARFGLEDGTHRVCAFTATGAGRGMQALGCGSLDVRHDPLGDLGAVRRVGREVQVRGWAFDPDREAAIRVHVYVGGRFVTGAVADEPRANVASAHPGRTHTGFDLSMELPVSDDAVCVYAVGVGRGRNESLGCASVPS